MILNDKLSCQIRPKKEVSCQKKKKKKSEQTKFEYSPSRLVPTLRKVGRHRHREGRAAADTASTSAIEENPIAANSSSGLKDQQPLRQVLSPLPRLAFILRNKTTTTQHPNRTNYVSSMNPAILSGLLSICLRYTAPSWPYRIILSPAFIVIYNADLADRATRVLPSFVVTGWIFFFNILLDFIWFLFYFIFVYFWTNAKMSLGFGLWFLCLSFSPNWLSELNKLIWKNWSRGGRLGWGWGWGGEGGGVDVSWAIDHSIHSFKAMGCGLAPISR